MAIYHPPSPAAAWNVKCWMPGKQKHHYVTLYYPDGRRVTNRKDALWMDAQHKQTCPYKRGGPGPKRLGEVLEEYLAATRDRRGIEAQLEEASKVKVLRAYVEDWLLHEVKPPKIAELLTQLTVDRSKDGKSFGAVRKDHYLKTLRACARYCQFKEYRVDDFTRGLQKRGKSPSRSYLPRAQWEALLAASATSKYHVLVMMALFTGLRASELAKLEARDVDLVRGVVFLRPEATKTNAAGCLALPEALIAALRPVLAPLRPSQRVFTFHPEALRRRVTDWLLALGLPRKGLGTHTLRHSFVTRAYELYDAYVAQQLARHASLTTTRRYTHLRRMPVSPTQMNSF